MRNVIQQILELLFYFSLVLVMWACSADHDHYYAVPPAVPVITDAGSACPSGGVLVSYANGPITTICNGQNGAQGVQGLQGNDATITVVQFCPGATSYPSEFNEVGFCLNGQVYGVYSANDGFASLLPPGAYTSNAIGSSCNFTILTNCQVQ